MIHAYVLIEAEPTRVQDLIKELPDMELDGSVIKQVHAVTGIAGAVGVRRTETCLVVW